MENNKREKSKKKGQKSPDKHGRIGRLDEHTLSYYRRVSQTLDQGFHGENDNKELFLKNVFNTLCDEALPVSQNQTASNIVEVLLHEASLSQLVDFGACISKDWELACSDRFASHVTQTFLLQLRKLIAEKPGSLSDGEWKETSEKAFDILSELYGFLMSNLAFHMQSIYTSHIVRVMLEILAGTRVSDRVIRSRVARRGTGPSKDDEGFKVCHSNKFSALFFEMCNKIAELNKIEDHIRNNLSNPVVQTMILVLHEKDEKRCQDVCEKLMAKTKMFEKLEDEEEDTETSAPKLPPLVQHEIASHFVEQILSVSSSETLDSILTSLKPMIMAMAIHPVANFVLQKLIKAVHNSDQFEIIFKKLFRHIEDILAMNHPQVVVNLAEGCVKHGTKQEKLIKSLQKAFHCYSPVERQIKCVPLFASLIAYETFYKSLTKDTQDSSHSEDSEDEKEVVFPTLTSINYHGSLLLQQLFKFGNPKIIVSSFFQMKSAELRTMACDPCGSHVIDAFMKSSSVSEKSRVTLCQRLKGLYVDLACHKHGSRTLDTIFHLSLMKHKMSIAEELSKHETRMRGEQFGRIIWYKYNIEHFNRNREQWKNIQTGKEKKRKMFEDIFDKSDTKKKQKVDTKVEEQKSNSLRLQDSDDDETETSSPKKMETKNNDTELKKKSKNKGKKETNEAECSDDEDDDEKVSHKDKDSKSKKKKKKKSKQS